MCMEYNGYSNYQTWIVSLMIQNDPGNLGMWLRKAQDASEPKELDEQLENWHESPLDDTSVFSSLLTNALGRVNWPEVSQLLWDSAHKDQEDNDGD